MPDIVELKTSLCYLAFTRSLPLEHRVIVNGFGLTVLVAFVLVIAVVIYFGYIKFHHIDVHADLRREVYSLNHTLLAFRTLVALTAIAAIRHFVIFYALDILYRYKLAVDTGEEPTATV